MKYHKHLIAELFFLNTYFNSLFQIKNKESKWTSVYYSIIYNFEPLVFNGTQWVILSLQEFNLFE
jgi:hypothetical protein